MLFKSLSYSSAKVMFFLHMCKILTKILIYKLYFVDIAWFGCGRFVRISKTYAEAEFVVLAKA